MREREERLAREEAAYVCESIVDTHGMCVCVCVCVCIVPHVCFLVIAVTRPHDRVTRFPDKDSNLETPLRCQQGGEEH